MTDSTPKHTNHLANQKSPYLLQHADNPVDWYPWGEEAFAKARKEDKPIFLSIGYSTCHWCHVMAHESFENEEIAKMLNQHFVCIKVDREERPDVDRVYMTFVQATTGSGGWPMSVWMTPELKPFVGGTYFPPTDNYGRPGFMTVLHSLAQAWENDRDKIEEQGTQMLESLRQYTKLEDGEGSLKRSVSDETYQHYAGSYDATLGGFGSAPKFPHPVTLNFLLRYGTSKDTSPESQTKAQEMVIRTLRAMADGGMYDHLGGGFHRYSVDAEWHVPHFEKMLYDQSQLVISYLEGFQLTGDKAFADTAHDVLNYVTRDMTADDGGFYSAEDADSLIEHGKTDHAEGAFYVWSKDKLETLLGDNAALFAKCYGVEADGNAPAGSDPHGEFTGKNILIRRHNDADLAKQFDMTAEEVSKRLTTAEATLLKARAKRPRPHLDDKIITAWNGLMISAFAKASEVLEETEYLAAATKAAEFLRENLYDSETGILLRSYREGPSDIAGFAEDYAFLIQGLLDLYEAGSDIRWLEWAVRLQEQQDTLFIAPGGGYYSSTDNDPSILLRMRESYDGAEPSANSVAALNLLRLGQMTGREQFTKSGAQTIDGFAEGLTSSPTSMPQMLVADDFRRTKPLQIVLAGDPGDLATKALRSEVSQRFLPRKVVLAADGGAGQQYLTRSLEFLETLKPIDDKPTAFLCVDYACQTPTTDAAKFGEQLDAQSAEAK